MPFQPLVKLADLHLLIAKNQKSSFKFLQNNQRFIKNSFAEKNRFLGVMITDVGLKNRTDTKNFYQREEKI